MGLVAIRAPLPCFTIFRCYVTYPRFKGRSEKGVTGRGVFASKIVCAVQDKMKKLARKVTRAAKVACQFKFTCTFEYIDLICVDGWKPENLQVVWLRGHRRIDSPTVKWVPKTENGNMVEGRATFDPPIAVSLLVTLYQGKDQQEYEQKEYKFYIENEGENGKKILASFNCNIADFAGVPSERHALDMTFKPISKKISRALLGLTMESEFLKKGKSSDDDMMSTFSRVSGHFEGDDAIGEEDEDNDPTTSTSSFQNIPMNTSISSEPSDSVASTMTNGFADESVVAATTATAAAAESNGETTPEATVVSKFVATPTMEGPCWLSDDIALINMDGQPVPKVTLDQTDLIGLYFSAEWCTPCKKFIPKLLKFYNYLIKEERSFQILYVSSDNTKDAMLGYMKEQNMPWLGLNFESPLGEQLRSDFKVSAIPLLCVVSRNGDIITDNTKKPVDAASSSEEEMTRLYNKWMHKLLEIKGLPVPDEVEPEKKKGLLSSLFGGKKKDKHQQQQQQPPQTDATAKNQDDVGETPPTSHKKSSKDTIAEQLLRQKEQLEHERVQERKVVQEKTQKLHVTLELNAQMQKDLNEKEEKIRILEAKNETYRQAADTKTDEIENLKQKVMMLEQELSSKADEEKKLLDEKRELLANISLHGWLCKRGIKGLTANTWRRRYFKIEEGCKLTYYKSAGDGPPQGFIDIDKIVSVKSVPVSQQDKTNCTFHIVTEGRTYELLAHDEATMNKWINSLQYMKEWRAKQKRES